MLSLGPHSHGAVEFFPPTILFSTAQFCISNFNDAPVESYRSRVPYLGQTYWIETWKSWKNTSRNNRVCFLFERFFSLSSNKKQLNFSNSKCFKLLVFFKSYDLVVIKSLDKCTYNLKIENNLGIIHTYSKIIYAWI